MFVGRHGDACGTVVIMLSLQLNSLTYEELQERMQLIDPEMEREIEELNKRYEAKRAPILQAIEAKKRRQQNF